MSDYKRPLRHPNYPSLVPVVPRQANVRHTPRWGRQGFSGGGGPAAAAPEVQRIIYVLGGQFDDEDTDLPVMIYATEETKPDHPPEAPEQATVTLGVDGSGNVIVDSFTPGSGYTGDEQATVAVVGDGTSAELGVTYDEGSVASVVVNSTSSDWTEASADLPLPLGFVADIQLPPGYGVGIEFVGSTTVAHYISFWGNRVASPRYVLPGGTIAAPGHPLEIVGSQTEVAADAETFETVLVRGI